MEASTPAPNSHRVSFGTINITPLKGKNRVQPLGVLDESNDDVERAERRRSVALRRSILALPSGGDRSAGNLNDSMIGFSEEDLKTQLQTFCKLHADNKISVRNVWTLRVIDVLKQIVTKNNPDVLKVAGNSLEIAGKVYGLRVDDLHTESFKMAGNLARNFASKGQDNDENQDPNATNTDSNKKKKAQKKRRNMLSGEKHTRTKDRKAFLGPLPKAESVAFSVKTNTTMSATANLFTSKNILDTVGNKFMFTRKEPSWQWREGNDPSVKEGADKMFPIVKKSLKNYLQCAPFKDFQVDMWDPNQQHTESFRKSNILEDVVLDDNGIPMPELDGSIHDVFQDRDDDVNDAESITEEAVAPLIREDYEQIVDFRPTEQALANTTERSAYSFNSIITTCSGKIDQIWAGPSHWKLKFIRRSRSVYSGVDRNQAEQNRKKGAAKKKNDPLPIDFRRALEKLVSLEPLPKKGNKKKHTVDTDKLNVPILDLACLKLLENIELLMTVPTLKPVEKKSEKEIEYQVNQYDYNNANDSNFCPSGEIGDDDGGDLADDLFDNAADPQHPVAFTGDNLVDMPEMVQQNYMHYATKAKRMDMKKLKQAVWCTLTQKDEFDLSAKVQETKFSQMYSDLPKILTERMKAEMSCPIAFVALLHLCNEQNLALKQHRDVTDFSIKGP